RAPLAILIAFLPIFAANVIFAKRFASTEHPTIAFATNLLGSMLGGSLEYLSLAFGYRALLIVAAGLYISAFLLRPSARRDTAPPEPDRELALAYPP
ncbi:MAG TPA: hypothetical protein VGL21_12280, partial [Jatrophihabitantaceae bacterium]